MNRVRFLKKIALAASVVFAMALTFSCTDGGGDEENNGGGGSGKGNDIANYKTVQIGDQWWMAENLDYDVEGSKCYNDSIANCNKYGRLYDWETANRVCPSGWHLPTQEEWDILTDFVDSENGCRGCAGKHLKAKSGWDDNDDGNGEDTYDFAALPGGSSRSGNFYDASSSGYWWSARESGYYAYRLGMSYSSESANWDRNFNTHLLSVRCVKD